jgi:hypothetical protein
MENTIAKTIVGLFICLALFGIINSVYSSKKEKIYTIGKIYEKTEPGKKTTYYFRYSIKKNEFLGKTTDLNRFTTNINGFIFLEILKSNYRSYHVLEFDKVPDCLTINDIPDSGWAKIPSNPCSHTKKP